MLTKADELDKKGIQIDLVSNEYNRRGSERYKKELL
jgi:hypothetical protein